ncbi:hypothetical protein WDW37_03655 [Bdellovibrionota bacterium FG-1]
MKVFRFFGLVWVGLSLAVGSSGFAGEGAGSSGGTDNRPVDSGAAWFLGSKPIRYCWLRSSDFGATDEQVTTSLSESFLQWKNYLQKVGTSAFSGNWFLVPEERRIQVNTERMSQCDGTEDLKFYFGSEDDLTRLVKKQYNHPTALAYRQSYDPIAGWGKGLIWVAAQNSLAKGFPDWAPNKISEHPGFAKLQVSHLTVQILHEIGHVLGCDHVVGTIMQEDIANWLKAGTVIWGSSENWIDGQRLLYLDGNRAVDVSGNFGLQTSWPGYVPYPPVAEGENEFFVRFIGRKPVGTVRSQLHLNYSVRPMERWLTVEDDLGKTRLLFEGSGKSSWYEFPVSIFRIVFVDAQGELRAAQNNVSGGISFESIIDQAGRKYPARIEFNMSSIRFMDLFTSPVNVFIDDEGGPNALFTSDVPGVHSYWTSSGPGAPVISGGRQAK